MSLPLARTNGNYWSRRCLLVGESDVKLTCSSIEWVARQFNILKLEYCTCESDVKYAFLFSKYSYWIWILMWGSRRPVRLICGCVRFAKNSHFRVACCIEVLLRSSRKPVLTFFRRNYWTCRVCVHAKQRPSLILQFSLACYPVWKVCAKRRRQNVKTPDQKNKHDPFDSEKYNLQSFHVWRWFPNHDVRKTTTLQTTSSSFFVCTGFYDLIKYEFAFVAVFTPTRKLPETVKNANRTGKPQCRIVPRYRSVRLLIASSREHSSSTCCPSIFDIALEPVMQSLPQETRSLIEVILKKHEVW